MCESAGQVAALPGEVVSSTGKQRYCQRTEDRSRFRAYEYALLTFRSGPLFPLMVEIWDLAIGTFFTAPLLFVAPVFHMNASEFNDPLFYPLTERPAAQ